MCSNLRTCTLEITQFSFRNSVSCQRSCIDRKYSAVDPRTAVVCGTDMFFLTVGRPALRLASSSAGTEVMGFLHMFGDARMPIWGVAAILSNFLLAVLSRSEQRWFYFASLLMLILFVISYLRL
jgi:hypothetical protein